MEAQVQVFPGSAIGVEFGDRHGAVLLENFLRHFGTVASEYRDASRAGNASDLAGFGESH
jgi:hypothetical protein